MRVVVDFTGPVGEDTGGATYARNVVPTWARTDDELVAIFSPGQTPAELRDLPCTVEAPSFLTRTPNGRPRPARERAATDVRSSLPAPSIERVLYRHFGTGLFIRRTGADVAFFPGNYMSFAVPKATPAVVAIRSSMQFHYPKQLPLSRRLYRTASALHAVRAAARVIVPSSVTADDLMRFAGAPRRKLVVVPHGVDLELFQRAPVDEVDPLHFLYVSKPWDYKGLATVFRAVAEAARGVDGPISLSIADGGLPPHVVESWMHLAAKVGVRQHVRFLGPLPHSRLALEYRRASALVLPTSYESFGNPFLEAAASGCPVITAYGHGIDETIGEVAVQVPAHHHAQLARAMVHCANMTRDEREARGAAARSWAETYSWATTVSRTRSVLAEVA